MPAPIILPRAPRSTRADLLRAEAHQAAVIAALSAAGQGRLADRLARCQRERQHRRPGSWPWRCGSAGCWTCRRTVVRRWWRNLHAWLDGPDTSLAVIPVPGDLTAAIQRHRKSLRDLRDRAARGCPPWQSVAMGGLAGSGRLMVLVQHAGIDRDAVWQVLERRWPDMLVTEAGAVEPSSALTVEEAVSLATRRRGIKPLRVVIPAQRVAFFLEERDPMPVLI